MKRRLWPLLLAALSIAILGSYLVYTEYLAREMPPALVEVAAQEPPRPTPAVLEVAAWSLVDVRQGGRQGIGVLWCEQRAVDPVVDELRVQERVERSGVLGPHHEVRMRHARWGRLGGPMPK